MSWRGVVTSREDVEMTAAGILYGRGHLDNAQFRRLGGLPGCWLRKGLDGVTGGKRATKAAKKSPE